MPAHDGEIGSPENLKDGYTACRGIAKAQARYEMRERFSTAAGSVQMKRSFRFIIAAGVFVASLFGAPFDTPGARREASLGCVFALASGQERTPAQLEEQYEKETNPKNRVKLAVELADNRLKEMLAAYDAADPAKEPAAAETYLSALDRLEKALDANTSGGTAKDAEIHLRHQVQSLGNLRMTLSSAEKTPVEKALARATQLHEDVLNRIMHPKKKGQ
jgi:hypothetical protein